MSDDIAHAENMQKEFAFSEWLHYVLVNKDGNRVPDRKSSPPPAVRQGNGNRTRQGAFGSIAKFDSPYRDL
jgi:hypothetical protein